MNSLSVVACRALAECDARGDLDFWRLDAENRKNL